jgi:hypothetical protein
MRGTDEETNVTKLILAFSNFVNALRNYLRIQKIRQYKEPELKFYGYRHEI